VFDSNLNYAFMREREREQTGEMKLSYLNFTKTLIYQGQSLVTFETLLLSDRLHRTRLFLNFDVSQSQHLLDQCTVF